MFCAAIVCLPAVAAAAVVVVAAAIAHTCVFTRICYSHIIAIARRAGAGNYCLAYALATCDY